MRARSVAPPVTGHRADALFAFPAPRLMRDGDEFVRHLADTAFGPSAMRSAGL